MECSHTSIGDNSGYLGWLLEWQGQVGDIRSRGIHTPHRSLFISAVACALPIQLRPSPDLHVTMLRPPIFSLTGTSMWTRRCAQPTGACRNEICLPMCLCGLALIFLFQIKACKERWDARCTRGAPRWRCAAAQDQIKMKITQFGLILWDGSNGPVKRCSSIDTQAELHARRHCHCSLLRDSIWIKQATG